MPPVPFDIELHQQSRVMGVVFSNGRRFELPGEYLLLPGERQQEVWNQYFERVNEAGASRE